MMFDRRRFLTASLAAPALALSPAALRAADLSAAAERAEAFGRVHTLLVLRDGEEILSRHFAGPGPDRPANIKSVSKSVVAALLGAAIDRGEVSGVSATLGAVAPGLIPSGADPAVAGITLEDLVTLRAGLERTSGGNYGDWVSSRNWVADALSRPMVAAPGTQMLYSTGSTHVLGAALAEAGGASLLSLARDRLGDPLGIAIPAWTRDPQGRYLGGNEMAMSPRAMARFGEMIRQGGVHNGTRVLSADWVSASLIPRTRSRYSGLGYGYGWFLAQAGDTQVALARGYGGQVIAVAPGLAATVVITSDPTQPARSGGYFGDLLRLIADDILAPMAA